MKIFLNTSVFLPFRKGAGCDMIQKDNGIRVTIEKNGH